MIVLLSALLMAGGPGRQERNESSLVRELATSAARLAQAKGLAARIDELATVAIRLDEALAGASQAQGRTEDAVYYARLAMTVAGESLLLRLGEVNDDDPANDGRYSRAVDAAARALELVGSLLDALPADQRSRVRPQYDSLSPKLAKIRTWMKERAERHDRKTAPPDGSPPRRDEKSPGGRSEVSPH